MMELKRFIMLSALLLATYTSAASAMCVSTGSNCISASSTACHNLPNGNYQACEGCTFYHSCSGGVNWARIPCPYTEQGGSRGHLVWQAQNSKAGFCDYSSTSCTECVSGTTCHTGSASNTACITSAITSCSSLKDGDYQACESCTYYHSCSNGLISSKRPCARRNDGTQLVWVTEGTGVGHCDTFSTTCKECPEKKKKKP